MHFGPVTEIDQQTWRRLSIGKAGPREEAEEVISHGSKIQTDSVSPASPATSSLKEEPVLSPQNDHRYFSPLRKICMGTAAAFKELAEARYRNCQRGRSFNRLFCCLAEK